MHEGMTCGMDDATKGQVVGSAAQVYDEFFLPALFQQYAGPVADVARVHPGDHVLDVACGTGVVALELQRRVGASGRVVGLDINPGMLSVARSKSDKIVWREGDVERLPHQAEEFDAVTCQFGLMFFPDQAKAIAEMLRVLKPGGRLVLSVWDGLASSPGYDDMVRLLDDLFGKKVADAMRAPFVLGDRHRFNQVLRNGGAKNIEIQTVPGVARFPSLEQWVKTDIKGWTLADLIDDEQYARLQAAAETRLSRHVRDDGVAFAAPAHVAVVTK